jgi:hypothetical protein
MAFGATYLEKRGRSRDQLRIPGAPYDAFEFTKSGSTTTAARCRQDHLRSYKVVNQLISDAGQHHFAGESHAAVRSLLDAAQNIGWLTATAPRCAEVGGLNHREAWKLRRIMLTRLRSMARTVIGR